MAIGAEHSSLARDVDRAAKIAGLAVSPDPEPEQVFFIRSDQYSFVKIGVPSLFVQPGLLDGRGRREANRAIWDRLAATRYHLPQDGYDGTMRFGEGARLVQFSLLVGLSVAMAEASPTWNPGAFYARFASGGG